MNRASMSRKIPKNSSFLPSKETEMSISDVPVSPAKKSRTDMSKEPRLPFKKTEVRLFGVSTPLSPPSSMDTDEELKTNNRLEDPKKDFVSTTLCLYDETWPCGNADYPNVTCAPRNEELTEQTITIKETKEDEEQYDETGQWTIKKVLNKASTQLYLSKADVECHILRHLSEDDQKKLEQGDGITVKVYDHDSDTTHKVLLVRWTSKVKKYCLVDGWRQDFIYRRGLRSGDKIGLSWDSFHYKLHFHVLSRAPTEPSPEERR